MKTTTNVGAGLCVILALSVFAISALSVGPLSANDLSHDPITIKKDKFKIGKRGKAKPLAEISDYCLGCHGSEAADAPQPAHAVGGEGRSHPVDVLYPSDRSGYTPGAALDPRLQLLDGKLACITCHDPQQPDHGLVLPESGSRLCLACHDR